MVLVVENILEFFQDIASSFYKRTRSTLMQILFAVFSFFVILWISMFLYGSFYYSYMPSMSVSREANLQFLKRPAVDGPRYPFANVSLLKSAFSTEGILLRGQHYHVVIEIELPQSEVNQDVGVFMVNLDLYSQTGKLTSHTARAAMLHYKTFLLQSLETFIFLPALLFNHKEEKQTVSVRMIDDFIEPAYETTVSAFIELEDSDVQVYSTHVSFYAHLIGLKYLMFYWPFVSAFFGISSNFCFLSVIMLLSWNRFLGNPAAPAEPVRVHSNVRRAALPLASDEENIDERRRRARALIEQHRRQQSLPNMQMLLEPRPRHRSLCEEAVHTLSDLGAVGLDCSPPPNDGIEEISEDQVEDMLSMTAVRSESLSGSSTQPESINSSDSSESSWVQTRGDRTTAPPPSE